jgi:hypothetical protein
LLIPPQNFYFHSKNPSISESKKTSPAQQSNMMAQEKDGEEECHSIVVVVSRKSNKHLLCTREIRNLSGEKSAGTHSHVCVERQWRKEEEREIG